MIRGGRRIRLIGGPEMGRVYIVTDEVVRTGTLYFAIMPKVPWFDPKAHSDKLTLKSCFYTPSKNPNYWAFRGIK
jgi:hypothetical protein